MWKFQLNNWYFYYGVGQISIYWLNKSDLISGVVIYEVSLYEPVQ